MSKVDPVRAVGVDVGAVLTKMVRLGEAPVVTRTPAAGEVDRFVGGLLARHGMRAVGVAVAEGGDAGRVSVPGTPLFVRGVLCAAAVRQHRQGGPAGRRMRLVCDVGARTTAAAVCVVDGRRVRLLRALHAESPDVGAAFGEPVEWLVNQSVARLRRARIVLDRAAADGRYRATPVYWGPDRAVSAEVVLRALRPVADRAGRVVRELLDVVGVPLGADGEVVLTGVFGGLQPVREAVATEAGGHPVVVLEPSAVAEGAGLVAAGVLAAEDDYPHAAGVLAHRVRHGLLEATVVTLAEAGRPLPVDAPGVVLTVPELTGPLPVRLRVGGAGPWRDWRTEGEVCPPAGEYAVTVVPGATSTGVLLLRPASGGPPLRCPLIEVPDGEDHQS